MRIEQNKSGWREKRNRKGGNESRKDSIRT